MITAKKKLPYYLNLKSTETYKMSILSIILSILLPPLAVFLKHGLGSQFLISLLLTLVGWLPGDISAFYVHSQ